MSKSVIGRVCASHPRTRCPEGAEGQLMKIESGNRNDAMTYIDLGNSFLIYHISEPQTLDKVYAKLDTIQ